MNFLAQAEAIAPELIALRRELHQHPEIHTHTPWTQARLLKELEGFDLEITLGKALTSITAVMRGGAAPADIKDRPVILLRTDMDGLPVTEDTGLEYASKLPERMHGCGHDMHMASVIGAIRLLAPLQAELPGDVVFMFQPAEETVDGAIVMVEEGVLQAAGKTVDWAFGQHVFSNEIPSGVFRTRSGPMMSAQDSLVVDIIGRGGHGSTPETALDPVPVMAEIITAIHAARARRFSMFDDNTINIGVARAGGAPNVIPETAHLAISIRSFTPENRAELVGLVTSLATGIASAWGLTAEVRTVAQTHATMNDPVPTEFALRQMRALFGEDRVDEAVNPHAASEDFSEILRRVPGTFIHYSGVSVGEDPAQRPMNHSAKATFDDAYLADATALNAQLVWAGLHELAGKSVS